MPRMNEEEVLGYLAEPGHLCRLATIDESGSPYVQPMWFTLNDGKLLVSPREKSLWLANLRMEPRVCVLIDEETLPHRKVTIKGEAKIAFDVGRDDEWLDVYRGIVERYWDPKSAAEYIDSTKQLSRALVEVPFAYDSDGVTNWRSLNGGEDYSGIWASRYWEPFTLGREEGTGPLEGQDAPRGL